MITVGLTGGIATGKSTVAKILKQAGARVIDADCIAREVVKPGHPAWQEIVEHFGKRVLLPAGEIDRKVLGDIIFNDADQKTALNRIVHPRVFEAMGAKIDHIAETAPGCVVILDIPLLFETGRHRDLAEIIVVYVPESIQLARLVARDGLSRRNALARIRSQMPIEEKKKHASLIIDNSGYRDDTRRQTLEIYRRLVRRA